MKTLLIVFFGALSIGVALPAFSSPDMQQIERGRKEKRAQIQQQEQMKKECAAAMKKTSGL